MRIDPFRAFRPKPETVTSVASVPYDVVSTEEARQLASGNPDSMLHVVRAEIDFPEGTDPYSDAVYAKAVDNLERLQREEILIQEESPSLYLYELTQDGHTQRGIAGLTQVADYEADLIKKHEKTRAAKENDRTRLTSDLAANPGPVFLTYRDTDRLTGLMDEAAQGTPLFDFEAVDGVRHRVWRLTEPTAIVEAFKDVPALYVADGHHRAASAARVGKERREANPGHTGEEAYNRFLSVMFPAGQLRVLPYNRLVKDLNGLSTEDVFAKICEHWHVEELDFAQPPQINFVKMYLEGRWHRIRLEEDPAADPVSRLDVSMLQESILNPILGIDDPRTNDRIDFVGGIKGDDFLQKEVDAGRAAVAFSMYPVTVEQLMDIADAGQIMPPKSTWFEPKLRSGLFVHTFEKKAALV